MKLEKVYEMILKKRLKEPKEQGMPVSIGRWGEKTAVILEHIAFLLPECLLDPDKFAKTDAAERLFREAYTDYRPIERMGAVRKIKSSNTGKSLLLRELEAGGIKVRVQSKYLQYFDHPEYQIKAPYKPVFVYEDGEICGLILPVRCLEEDWERGEWR